MTDTKAVFLIGFMGSGKTTWGRKLANKTGRAFIDLDETIVNELGTSIADYFAAHGEASFRELESRILKSLPLDQPTIIATGGGAPCYFDNMTWMNEVGLTIYLYLPPKALWDRLMQTDIASRPALNGLSGEELLTYIQSKLAERESYYLQAAHVANQLSLQLEELVRLVS
ncbi:shikimate kinase [Parapedobacter koreensis]|uniref:Shikimate kinase n=1 Tax=Parapedobacter koreensis TaxID=332977 RepID=A0A1H7I3T3_9SPHI|nr:shikimate kinase [Parapedobacter koreensis]SEK57189.1 shikimate kinase [Parapedobacter koreensis]